MGIPELWNIIKEQDQSVPLAQLAEHHFKQHGRPLRIAVDEADWRFNNLTTQQVYIIREKSNEPAFQGIEKSMFYRICRILTLNIQLLFVFDGPGRPWKRGRRGGGRIDYEKLRLFKELLRHFRIPYHEAPGEAEAECARLQQLGVVDAVFSQDSDSLMFGCDYLIRDDRLAKEKGNTGRAKENTRKSNKTVKIVRGSDIKAMHNLDKDGLVLFAMLCGGDYDMQGLPRCGPAVALRAIKAGLGASLCRCRTRNDCMDWREELVSWIQTQRSFHGNVPFDYPDIKILTKYNQPKVSSDDQLCNLRGLRNGWDRPIDELELLELTSSRFNIWGRLYMNWVGPVLLTKYLATRDPTLPALDDHQIQLKRRTKKEGPPPSERNLTFSPFGLTSLRKEDFEGERAGYWTNAISDPFEPNYRVEKEIPEYLLRKVLLPEVLDPPPKTPRKRKAPVGDEDGNGPVQSAAKRKRKAATKKPTNTTPTSTSRPTPTRRPPMTSQPECISLLSDSEDATPSHEPRRSIVVDLGLDMTDSEDEDEDEEEEEQFNKALQLSLQQYAGSASDLTKPPTYDNDIDWIDREPDAESLFVPEESPTRMGAKVSRTLPAYKPPISKESPASQSKVQESVLRDPANLAEIRAARLRFFDSQIQATDSSSASPSRMEAASHETTQPTQSPRARTKPMPTKIPPSKPEIEVVDLTDV
ncbi:PIN domain-like protein [Massarina eburnea CBS 473.64]|uniref:PIN domain-like protein n=1 Tax=Massarina eburnea CBS 473.64 TaxID=1395130 RepID=A0A6A6SJU9_9PLEO|nr:PIN domain-like protein [Massarina eburnea CBS 473.64]